MAARAKSLYLLTVSLQPAIELAHIILGAASQHCLIGAVGALLDTIAGRSADYAGSVAAAEVGLRAMLALRYARQARLVRAIGAVADTVAHLEGGDAASVAALELVCLAGAVGKFCSKILQRLCMLIEIHKDKEHRIILIL